MAQTEPVLFVDGPCDGQVKQVANATLRTGQVRCGGQVYLIDISLATRAHPFVAALKGGPHEVIVTHPKVSLMGAWSRWMHVLAHRGPQAHRRTLAVTGRANRIARHR